jgi:hypothetical protein
MAEVASGLADIASNENEHVISKCRKLWPGGLGVGHVGYVLHLHNYTQELKGDLGNVSGPNVNQ